MWVASLTGLVVAIREARSRRAAICLAPVMVSYYVGFIDIILYNYDRYFRGYADRTDGSRIARPTTRLSLAIVSGGRRGEA
jgi:hypothetical protein